MSAIPIHSKRNDQIWFSVEHEVEYANTSEGERPKAINAVKMFEHNRLTGTGTPRARAYTLLPLPSKVIRT